MEKEKINIFTVHRKVIELKNQVAQNYFDYGKFHRDKLKEHLTEIEKILKLFEEIKNL